MFRTAELTHVDRTVSRCVVCGSRDVRTDAVEQRGWVLLAECPHCDHRWTQRLPDVPAPVRAPARVPSNALSRPEVASAA